MVASSGVSGGDKGVTLFAWTECQLCTSIDDESVMNMPWSEGGRESTGVDAFDDCLTSSLPVPRSRGCEGPCFLERTVVPNS